MRCGRLPSAAARISQTRSAIKVDRYQIALKTGTAETGDQNNSNNLWVVSFAPAEDPQYVVVVNHAGAARNRHGYELVSAVADIYDYLFRSYVG